MRLGMKTSAGSALAACAFLALAPLPAEAATCKRSHVSGLGNWSNTFAGARLSARLAWKRKAYAAYGSNYDAWWRSDDKSYGCWSHEGRERCRAKARPCQGW